MALPNWAGVVAGKLLNKTQFVVRIAHGTKIGVKRPTAYGWSGELTMTTDTDEPHLYVPQTIEGEFRPIQTIDMIVVHSDDVVFHNSELVYQD